MPAFSHFFLKRLSARSKFSSSWIMTSDKFYFPPSRRHASPAWVQTAKLSRLRRMGQANRPSFRVGRHGAVSGIGAGASEGAGTSGTTVARAEPLTTLVRSAHSRVSLVAPLSPLRPAPSDSPAGRAHTYVRRPDEVGRRTPPNPICRRESEPSKARHPRAHGYEGDPVGAIFGHERARLRSAATAPVPLRICTKEVRVSSQVTTHERQSDGEVR
jgi:hypothetical protein